MTAHPIHQSRERHACLLHDLGSHREPDGSNNSRTPTRRIPNSRLRLRARQINPNIMHSTSFHVNSLHPMNERFHRILYQKVDLLQGNLAAFNICFLTTHPIPQSRERHACLLHHPGSHREPDGSKNSRNPTRRTPNSRLSPRTRQTNPNIMHSTPFPANNIHPMNQRFHRISCQSDNLFQET